MNTDAILVVDPQNDFCRGGTLEVPGGDEVVEPINKATAYAVRRDLPTFISRDWHPEKTKHFKTCGGIWPPHCVHNTKGAEFHPDLNIPNDAIVISKGMGNADDGYSSFEGTDENGIALEILLRRRGVNRLFIDGLATDYCVKKTVLDALRLGFKTYVLRDAIRAVDLKPGDGDDAIDEMIVAGATFIETAELINGKI